VGRGKREQEEGNGVREDEEGDVWYKRARGLG
jgi:hypothetical protein